MNSNMHMINVSPCPAPAVALPGYFLTSPGSDALPAEAAPCPLDTFNDADSTADSCTPCPAGLTTADTPTDSAAKCGECSLHCIWRMLMCSRSRPAPCKQRCVCLHCRLKGEAGLHNVVWMFQGSDLKLMMMKAEI
jgi:hypothetical protein